MCSMVIEICGVNMEKWIYVISIALQLSGAILLIIKYWFGSAKEQLSRIQNKRTRDVGEGHIILGDSLPSDQEFIEELWISRIAFIYIAAGYIVGIWGSIESTNKNHIALMTILISFILVYIGKVISYLKGKHFQSGEELSK